jgi:hypothetical protein
MLLKMVKLAEGIGATSIGATVICRTGRFYGQAPMGKIACNVVLGFAIGSFVAVGIPASVEA